MPLSHFIPAYPSPSPCPQVHSLHLRLYSCPVPRFFMEYIKKKEYLYQLLMFEFCLPLLSVAELAGR